MDKYAQIYGEIDLTAMHSINLFEIKQFFKAFTKPKSIKTIIKSGGFYSKEYSVQFKLNQGEM